jgi:tetratricopeptide (TPR) repeat protein
MERSVAYYEFKQYEKSIVDAMKVIQLDPDNNESRHAGAYVYTGYSRYRLGQYQNALDNFNKVLELDPISEDHDPFYLKNWMPNTKNALSK